MSYGDLARGAKAQAETQANRKIPMVNDTDNISVSDADNIRVRDTDTIRVNKDAGKGADKRKTKQITLTIDVGTKELKEYWIQCAREEGETVSGLFKRYMLRKYGRPQ